MKFAIAAAVVALSASAALAQPAKTTVQALLEQEFQVVGMIPSQAGPGLFLQKKDKLFFCLVSETTTSVDVSTRYCKPVR